MGRFVEGADRSQLCFLPERLDDWVDQDNAVQVIEAFVEALDLPALGFIGATPASTGRPAYHPAALLKLYSRRLLRNNSYAERFECPEEERFARCIVADSEFDVVKHEFS